MIVYPDGTPVETPTNYEDDWDDYLDEVPYPDEVYIPDDDAYILMALRDELGDDYDGDNE
jgi:hypothetical protein